jgi:hypothetical protein
MSVPRLIALTIMLLIFASLFVPQALAGYRFP